MKFTWRSVLVDGEELPHFVLGGNVKECEDENLYMAYGFMEFYNILQRAGHEEYADLVTHIVQELSEVEIADNGDFEVLLSSTEALHLFAFLFSVSESSVFTLLKIAEDMNLELSVCASLDKEKLAEEQAKLDTEVAVE